MIREINTTLTAETPQVSERVLSELEIAPGPAAVESASHDHQPDLRRRLMLTDGAALLISWFVVGAYEIVFPLHSIGKTALLSLIAIVIGYWSIYINELYLARVSMVRAVELSRLFRVGATMAVSLVVVLRVFHLDTRIREVLWGSLLTVALLTVGRSAFRAWVSTARRDGRFVRHVMVVGANRDAADLVELISEHPETGLRLIGVAGDPMDAIANSLRPLRKCYAEDVGAFLRGYDNAGVILVTTALETDELSSILRDLQSRRIHVQLSNGVRGINYRRLRVAPIVHEPLYYVEQSGLQGRQALAKRAIDIVLSLGGIIALSPLFLLIAALIKLTDRGPVFFGQVRVGKDSRQFRVLKFRSMVVDAEARLKELQAANERSGPLFKMERDPRITRVGHILRETSLDELPQLINVLKGEMSLVGPRPALPAEVAQFDERLLERTKVRPGITGLWQVEARDNPSFNAYRRLDLFYVDNWTASLDFVIMLATVEQVVAKGVRMLVKRRKGEADLVAELSPAHSANVAA